ncbi:MAG: LamG-like jellyroll fold domain-containing protein [Planctomycetota bacterium]|jgi:hypothetical protein
MCKKLTLLTLFVAGLALASTNTAFGVFSVDVRVAAGSDDREEHVGSGSMEGSGSSDLELGHEGAAGADTLQTIGVRFTGVDIPAGAAITKAYVQFAVDDKDNPYHTPPVSLIVGGELSPNPVTFSSSTGDISTRPATTASVVWDIPTWGANQGSGPDQRTPDISRVIQEIIDQDGWAAGNAMVVILRDNPANPSEGTREAESFNGDAAFAPLLHVEYTIRAATDPDPADGGVSGRAPLLQWTKGATAAFHDVYLGTSPDLGPAELMDRVSYAAYWHIPGLTPGTTYYWRVDEVEADGTTIYTGDVWSFTAIDVTAHSPSPPSGDKMALPDVVLSWGAGLTAASHDVYFGTDRAAVAAGTGDTFKGNQTVEAYNPVDLENGTTYYWRIDEVEADGTTKHPGDLWSFKTRDDPTLIGWWKFDEGQGLIAYDSSGYGHHGIIGHDNGDDGPLWAAGAIGGGLQLDGDDDYISIDSIVPMMTSLHFTFSIWVKTDVDVDDHVLLGSNTDSSHEFLFGINNGSPWQETSAVTAEYPPKVTDNQWHMLTYVANRPTSQIYVDGVLRKEDDGDDDFPEETRWSIGQEWDSGPSDEYQGILDDARLWNRPLTAEEVAEVFKGDVDLAHSPQPISGSTPDVEHVPPISWSPGEGATQHDVYFGTDELAVGDADITDTAGIYRIRQSATSYTPPEGLPWGSGPYYWRIDEVKADGTVSKGMVWTFSVGDFLNVDDFESYNNIDPPDPASNTIFASWPDGFGVATNGALVGNDSPPYAETRLAYVHSGAQAMPYIYGDLGMGSETTHTLTGTASDFTRQGVGQLSLWFRGETTNAVETMSVALNGVAIAHTNPNAVQVDTYEEWVIPLQDFADLGVTLNNVTSIAIRIGTLGGASGTGTMSFDDIRLFQVAP